MRDHFEHITRRGSCFFDRTSRQLEYAPPAQTQGDSPGSHPGDGFDDLLVAIEEQHVDVEAHEESMNAFARDDPEAFAFAQAGSFQQPGTTGFAGVCFFDRVAQRTILGPINNAYFCKGAAQTEFRRRRERPFLARITGPTGCVNGRATTVFQGLFGLQRPSNPGPWVLPKSSLYLFFLFATRFVLMLQTDSVWIGCGSNCVKSVT